MQVLSSETVSRAPLPVAGTIIKNAPTYASKEASASIGTPGSIESFPGSTGGSLGSSIESYAVIGYVASCTGLGR